MSKLNTESILVLNFLPVPTAWFDEDLNFVGANKKFYEIFHLSEEQIVGEHFSQFFDTYSFMSFMGQFIKGLDENTNFNQSLLIDRKLTHFKFSLQKITSPERIVVLCAEDITSLV